MDIELIMDDTQKTNAQTILPLGARLKAAREALRLTEKEAAQRLHLNVKFITMMEGEDFKGSLPTTFMRGYLRSYAKLLHLSEEETQEILSQIDINPEVSATTPTQPSLRIPIAKKNDRYIHWITSGIIIILIAMVGIWWSSHSRYNTAEVPPAAATATPAPTAATPPEAPTNSAEPVVTAPSAVTAPAAETAPTVAAPTTPTEPATPAEPVLSAPAAAPQPNVPPPAAPAALTPPAPVMPEATGPAPATAPSANPEGTPDLNAAIPAATPLEADETPPPKPKRRHRIHEEPTHVSLPEPGLEDLE